MPNLVLVSSGCPELSRQTLRPKRGGHVSWIESVLEAPPALGWSQWPWFIYRAVPRLHVESESRCVEDEAKKVHEVKKERSKATGHVQAYSTYIVDVRRHRRTALPRPCKNLDCMWLSMPVSSVLICK